MLPEDETVPIIISAKGVHADGWINKQASLVIACNQPLQLYFLLPDSPLLANHKTVCVRYGGIEHRIQVKRGEVTPTTYFSPNVKQINFSFECEYPEIATNNEQRKLGVKIDQIRVMGRSPIDFLAFMRSSFQQAKAVISQGPPEGRLFRELHPLDVEIQKGKHELKNNRGSIYSFIGNDVRGDEVAHHRMVGVPSSIQCEPMNLPLLTGETRQIFIEDVSRDADFWAVRGWSTLGNIELILHSGKHQVALETNWHRNAELCTNLGLPASAELGFSASCRAPASDEAFELEIRYPHGEAIKTGPLAYKDGLSAFEKYLFPGLFADDFTQLTSMKFGSLEWGNALSRLPRLKEAPPGIRGFIEGFIRSPEGNAVVFGWALHPDDVLIWIETSDGEVYASDKWFRRFRYDVSLAYVDQVWGNLDAGFIAYLPKVSTGSKIKLCVATSRGKIVLSEQVQTDVFSLDPRSAAETLFSIESEVENFHRRAAGVDWPILEPLIARRVREAAKVKPEVYHFGKLTPTPKVSVIVPLYKRFDFIEHQVMEFCRDKSFRESTELIYVIDDPEIKQRVLTEASVLFSLYEMPIKVVDGRINRGFSESNNLGARHAQGDYLLFMNSDVIPNGPGWLPRMLEMFDSHKTTGAVGARLLFPDGGLQHAGMESIYVHSHGIWTNQHPAKGMSPDNDSDAGREVQLVTGACLLLPKYLFERVGGWDAGYLLGDFEDSDLCFAIQEAGYSVLYQPEAILTHLERQSFIGLGSDRFRLRMTICNGVRHQQRWAHILA
jgi:GT2 family glycosyltransferase